MSWLWTAGDAAAATGGTATGGWEGVSGISIDTRSLVPGDLFVALKGENRDGHAFVADALAKGAGAALVSERPDGVAEDAPLLVVDDTMAALEALGRAGRGRARAKVIGVTGSVGKTGTKEMLRTMLSGQGSVHAAAKSFNNHWGVPLTLALLPPGADFAVIEIGMNHAGEIAPLSRMARPDVAVITTVEAVHLGNFDSVEEIADAKAEIFAGLAPGGTAVLNADNPHFARLAEAAGDAEIVRFGRAEEAEFRVLDAGIRGLATVVRGRIGAEPICFKLGAPGLHLVGNAMAALAAARAVGADVAIAALDLAGWSVPAGRGARWRISLGPAGLDGEIELIDESYNANPASVKAALAVLAAADVVDGVGRIGKGRRLAFLGDMLELGPDEEAIHAALAGAEEISGADLVFTAGPLMKALHEALPPTRRGQWFPDSAAMAGAVRRVVDAGDVCMVKGSLGSRMAPVVDAIKAAGTAVPVTVEPVTTEPATGDVSAGKVG